MKKLDLRHSAYKELLVQFETHLKILNYSKGTVYGSVSSCKEYLFYLQNNNLELLQSDTQLIQTYFEQLQKRVNHVRTGGLSASYLNKHHHGLSLFFDYLILNNHPISKPTIPVFKNANYIPKVLTVKEVEQLFKSCANNLLGKRNKAMLALYYGCGLRKKEGVCLKMEDVDLEKEEVFITQSKTHRQRRVPMSEHVKSILEDYVFNVREKLVPSDKSVDSFLVTEKGKPMSGETAVYTLKKLLSESKINTPASLHTLRHSIATHLLQSGMKLENIALFLGHRSLDSSQIYTHINTNQDENI